MKKTLAVILSIFLITSNSIIVYADTVTNQISDESSIVFDQAAADYYSSIGSLPAKSPRAACYELNGVYLCETESISISGITSYYQNGQSWSSTVLNGCTDTIGNSGCAITAFAMIASKYGSKDNPGQVNTKLGTAACPFVYGTAASKYGLSYSNIIAPGTYSLPNVKTTILGALRVGRPVMLVVKSTSTTHFIVVSGYKSFNNGSYYFYIKDPSNPGKATVNACMDAGYTVRLAYVYYK